MPIGSLYTDLSGSLGCARGTLFSSDDDEINDLRSEANLAAWYDASNSANLTVDSVGRVSQWNDTSTFASRHLLQGTAASQPIYLPWSGQNYGYCPGVAGNYFSTPDSAAVSVTGDIDLRCYVSPQSWTTGQALIAKYNSTGSQKSYYVLLAGTGTQTIRLGWSTTGADDFSADSTTFSQAANTPLWVRVTLQVNDGSGNRVVKFYTSSDGSTWVQLGSTITTAGVTSIFNSTSAVEIGSANAGAGSLLTGNVLSAQILNGIDGTVVAAFDPSRATDGASSFVAATGETWTVNTSGGKPAQIVGRPSVLFDGVDDFLKTAAFTLNQPETVYFVGKQVSWTSIDAIFDGLTANTGKVAQFGSGGSPRIDSYAGGISGINNAGLAIMATGVVSALFNGNANSLLGVNRLSPSNLTDGGATAAPGTASMGGFTIGAEGNNANSSNIQCSAVAIFAAAHDARTRTRVIDYLVSKYSIPV